MWLTIRQSRRDARVAGACGPSVRCGPGVSSADARVPRKVVPRSRPAGEGDARPLHAERPGVGLAVGGVVQHGEHVVEQVFDLQAKAFQVAPGSGRQVGAAPRAVVVTVDTARGVIGRPRFEAKGGVAAFGTASAGRG